MKRVVALMIGFVLFAGVARALAPDTPQALKAKELVQKAVAFYKEKGLAATVAAVNDTKGPFVDGEYYVFIETFEGINIARGDGNTKRIGTYVLEDKDPNGVLFIQEMIKKVKKEGSGWVTYGYLNRVTHKVLAKHSYVEGIDGAIVGCGYYQ